MTGSVNFVTVGQNMRILIVEDSDSEAFLIETLFCNAGAFTGELVRAKDVEKALEHIEAGAFDIVFVDHFLGAATGTALIQGAGGRKCPTPMILMSGLGSPAVEAEALEAGAVDYIDKDSLSAELLLRTVRFTLKNHEQALQAKASELYHQEIAAKAQAASDEKTSFLANMSHELRAPLNAIIDLSETLQKDIAGEIHGPNTEQYNEYMEDIHRSSLHLMKRISDVLDMSQIDAGGIDINLEETHLNYVIEEVMIMTLMQASDKDIDVEFAIPPNLLGFSADSRLLGQVLINLVANSIKVTPNGGRVDITAAIERQNLVIRVHDTGSGMEQTEIARFTNPGVQPLQGPATAGSAASDDGAGLLAGLGLSVCKSIMEMHLGGKPIDSVPGEGTCATIWLPSNLNILNNRPS